MFVPPLNFLHVNALLGELVIHGSHHLFARCETPLLVGEVGSISLLELGLDAILYLPGSTTLQQLSKGEGEALCDAAGIELLWRHVGMRKSHIDKVVWYGVVVLHVEVRDKLQKRVLQLCAADCLDAGCSAAHLC